MSRKLASTLSEGKSNWFMWVWYDVELKPEWEDKAGFEIYSPHRILTPELANFVLSKAVVWRRSVYGINPKLRWVFFQFRDSADLVEYRLTFL